MKLITLEHYNSAVEAIVKEKERQAEKLGQAFEGIDAGELKRELDKHFGTDWGIKKEESVRFTKADINAVASARFFRKTGVTLLMSLLIVLVTLALAVKSLVVMTPLYYNLYYTACGVIAIGFIWVYSRKQAKVRKELWRQMGRDNTENGK